MITEEQYIQKWYRQKPQNYSIGEGEYTVQIVQSCIYCTVLIGIVTN
jgi:hypothetical protein